MDGESEMVRWLDEQRKRRMEIIDAPKAANTKVPFTVQLLVVIVNGEVRP